MMKRLASALLASMLVLALACVSLAGETTAGQQAEGILPAVPADSGVSTIIFAVSAGTTGKDDDNNREAILLLMKPLLARLMGTDARVGVYKMDDKAAPVLEDAPLKTAGDLEALYSKLAFSVPKVSDVESAFNALCRELRDKYTKPEYASAQKTELWLVDRRAPMSSPKYNLDSALSSLQAMMDALPGLEVHFVYLLDKAPSDDPGRIDSQLLQRIGSPSRVMTHLVDISDPARAFDGVMNIVRGKLLAAVPCVDITAEGEKDVWTYTYSHQPKGETGGALLLLPPDNDIKNLTVEKVLPQETQTPLTAAPAPTGTPADTATSTEAPAPADTDQEVTYGTGGTDTAAPTKTPAAQQESAAEGLEMQADIRSDRTAVFGKNAGWVLLYDAPAGDYTVTLTLNGNLKDGLKPPVMKAYRMIVRPDISLTYVDPTDKKEKPLNDNTIWYRGPYTVNIYADAAELDAGQWNAVLYRNGVKDESIKIKALSSQNGRYRWRATVPVDKTGSVTLRAALELSGLAAFYSESVTAVVENRKPEASSKAKKEYNISYDLPSGDPAEQDNPLKINLGKIFSDKDKDQLYYGFMDDPNNYGTYRAEIKDNYFMYTPLSGTKDVKLTLWALDLSPVPSPTPDSPPDPTPVPADSPVPVLAAGPIIAMPSGTASFEITIHQFSLADCVMNWRFVFLPEESQGITEDGNGGYLSMPGKELKLVFAMAEKEKSLKPFEYYSKKSMNQSQTLKNLSANISNFTATPPDGGLSAANPAEDSSSEIVPVINMSQDKLTVAFPQTSGSVKYDLKLNALYSGVTLPDLIVPITLTVVNTPPALRDGVDAQQEWGTYINGTPWSFTPVSLSEILQVKSVDLGAYFTDKETPDGLSYSVAVSGSARYEVKGLDPVQSSVDGQMEYVLPSDKSTPPVLDLTLMSMGTLKVSVTAKDGASGCTLVFTIQTGSSFYRILWIVGLSLLALLVLTAAALWIRYLLLPCFKDVSVTVSIASDGGISGPSDAVSRQVLLDVFGKKSVSLLTLLMIFQLPPQEHLSAGIADDIRIRPDRRAPAAITIGMRASRQRILINGKAVHGRSFAVNNGQWEIATHDSSEAVILTFEQGEDRSWNNA
jgi:hypothetical protein